MRDILAIPFGYALSWLYSICGNYLIALVIITVALRLILLPSSIKQQKNAAKQMRLQAKVNKIRARYAGQQSREAQMKIQEETQELYRREGFSAGTAGCLPLLFQLIVMMGLYGAIYSPLQHVLRFSENVIKVLSDAYYVVINTPAPDKANYRIQLDILSKFTEIKQVLPSVDADGVVTQSMLDSISAFLEKFKIFNIDLTDVPNEWRTIGTVLLLIPVFAGLTAFLSSGFTYIRQRKTNPEMAKNPTMGCMTFMSPLMSVFFAYTLPAGIGFYWIISNILSFIQVVVLAYAIKPANIIAQQMIDETVTRRSREESIKTTKAILKAQEENQNN